MTDQRARRTVFVYNEYWRRRAAVFAQGLAERVSRLSGHFYTGCGYHDSVESKVVSLTHELELEATDDRAGVARALIVPLALQSYAALVVAAEVEVFGVPG
jgi:hypothetical protein